ncbi:MAG: DUF4363 family protein [Clostridiaceae bacterium]
MKRLIFPIFLFFSMILFIVLGTNFSNNSCKELKGISNKMEIMIENNQWDECYNTSIKLLDTWKISSKYLSIFINHSEIDSVNTEIWKLTQYTKFKNKDESLACIHTIKFLMEHIKNIQKPSLQNIF